MTAFCACLATIAGLAALAGLAVPAQATELKPETVAAFESYVRTREAQMEASTRMGSFLYTEALPETSRKELESQLRQGEFLILGVSTISDSQPVHIPNGLIHDWMGMAFIPGATAAQVNAVLQDFDHQQTIYKPDIRRSRLLERNGNQYKISLQFYTKVVFTVIMNGYFNVDYTPLGETRAESKSYSTRFAEVEDAGKPSEHEAPAGKEHGYMWRMNSYWKVEQKDGGVYIQVESIGLTRGIPFLYAWLADPLLRSLPQRYLADLLSDTRKAVIAEEGVSAGSGRDNSNRRLHP